MKYQKYVKRISETLAKYKAQVDELEITYNAEQKKVKEEAAKMKGQWTDEYIDKYIAEHNPDSNIKEKFQRIRSNVEPIVVDSIDRLQKCLDKYFNAPINSDFANKIMAIKLSGLQLSDLEFKILQDSATSYMECRLLNQLAETRVKKGQVVDIGENGEGKQREIDVLNPYTMIDLPDIEQIYKEFNNYKVAANGLLYSYSGTNAGMSRLLDKDIPSYISVSMNSYFKNDYEQRFSQVMEKANAILPESKVKRVLTENDKRLIDTLVDSKYPSLAKERVVELAEADADIGELLSLDERYSEYLEE